MRVVIDTNVLISAVLKDRDPEAVILFVAERDDMEWIVSPEIMTEYREVLSRPKFGLPDDVRQSWLLRDFGREVDGLLSATVVTPPLHLQPVNFVALMDSENALEKRTTAPKRVASKKK